MIVPMKKITVIAQSKDTDSVLKALGRLGVLHIEHEQAPVGEGITSLKEKKASLIKAMDILPDVKDQHRAVPDPEGIVRAVLNLEKEREVLTESLRGITRDIEIWKEWGDFDQELIDDFEDRNIWVRLCKITKKEAQSVPEGAILEVLFTKANLLYCAVISKGEVGLPFHALELPEKGLDEMLLDQREEEDKLTRIEEKLLEMAGYKKALLSHKRVIESLIEFNEAIGGMGRFEQLSYLKGYAPSYCAATIEKAAEKERWAIMVEDPGENDTVPTLVKNPAWVEIIKPMFNIINTIPGYKELDISLHFLIFFSIFFGMLIGDAGYGLVYFLIALIAQKRFKGIRDKSIFFLTYVLSSCAITWGLITGVFFGPHPWLRPLVPYFSDNTNVQAFCFLIGAVQLSIAHIWKFLRKMPSLKALADIGWICILWSAYFLAKALILNLLMPGFIRWVFIAGSVQVILFTSPAKNIFAGIGIGVGDFLLKVVSSFADIVSYIRLFAVGLAGVAIADAFNQMAAGIGAGGGMGLIFAVLILFAGHTLNLAMGILAILVHGVRLNVLEFSGHLDMEWSGVEYSPFKL